MSRTRSPDDATGSDRRDGGSSHDVRDRRVSRQTGVEVADGPDGARDARGPAPARARRAGDRADRLTTRGTAAIGLETSGSAGRRPGLERLTSLGDSSGRGSEAVPAARTHRLRFRFRPAPGTSIGRASRQALGAARGGLEVLCLGTSARPRQAGRHRRRELEAAYGVSAWRGPLAIGHTRMSTESRIDLSHSQPFWAHGVPDLATVHNGHVTNYHQLRRRYEQAGRHLLHRQRLRGDRRLPPRPPGTGRTLPEALSDSIDDLDGAFNYLVASPEGLGIVRDRFGFKPLMLAETDDVRRRRHRGNRPPPGPVRRVSGAGAPDRSVPSSFRRSGRPRLHRFGPTRPPRSFRRCPPEFRMRSI